MALWPVRPLGRQGGEVDRGSKGAKGEVGTAIDVPPQIGLVFHPTTPALSAATISKMPLKPPLPSSTESTGVAIPNNKTLTEYDAVALAGPLFSATTPGLAAATISKVPVKPRC